MVAANEMTILDELDMEIEKSYDLIDQLRDAIRIHRIKFVFMIVVMGSIIAIGVGSVIIQTAGRGYDLSSEARVVAGLSTLFGAFFLFESGSAAYSSYIVVLRGRRVLERHLRALSGAHSSLDDGFGNETAGYNAS